MPNPLKPEPRVVHARNAAGRPICNGIKRGEDALGEPCQEWRRLNLNNGRCPLHAGNAGRPPTTSRHSALLRGRVGELFRAAEADPQLLDPRHVIAKLDALEARLGERAHELDTPAFRQRALRLFLESQKTQLEAKSAAVVGDDSEAQRLNAEGARLYKELEDLLRRGAEEDKALKEWRVALVTLGKRIEGAWKILLARQTAVTARDFVNVMRRLLDVIQRKAPPDVARTLVRVIQSEVFDPALRVAEIEEERRAKLLKPAVAAEGASDDDEDGEPDSG